MLGEKTKKQIIFEAETLAAVVALCLWMPLFESGSDNEVVDKLSQLFASAEHESKSYLWLSRVTSYSNIADEPSRGKYDHLVKSGATQDSI